MPAHRRVWSKQEDDAIRNQLADKVSLRDLAKMLGIKRDTIRIRVKELGIELQRWNKMSSPDKSRPIRIPKNDPLLARLRKFHRE